MTTSPLSLPSSGSALPRVATPVPPGAPDCDATLGLLVAAGRPPLPWVVEAAEHVMRRDADGWSTPDVGLLVGRQNGKTELVVGRMLDEVALRGGRGVYVAHVASTSSSFYARCREVVDRVPLLRRRLTRAYDNGRAQFMEFGRGHRLVVLTAGGRVPRGLDRVSLLVYDEARELRGDAYVNALDPTQAATGAGQWQRWLVSNAGDATSRVLNLAREGRAGAWLEWSGAPGCDLDDEHELAAANPGLGVTVDLDYLARARTRMSEAAFRTEHLCQWVDLLDAWLPPRLWDELADPHATVPDSARPVFAFDLNRDLTAGAVLAAWRRPDGRTHVEVVAAAHVDAGPVSEQVAQQVRALAKRWRPTRFGYDPRGPAAPLADRLAGERLPVEPMPAAELPTSCASFLDDVLGRRLVHPGDPVLAAAVRVAVARPRGDGWVFTRRDALGDVSALYAAVVAVWLARRPALRPVTRSPKASTKAP